MKKQIQYTLATLAIIGSSLFPQNSLAEERSQDINETRQYQEQEPIWTFVQTEHPNKEECGRCMYYKVYKPGETNHSFYYETNFEKEKIRFVDFPREGVDVSFYPCSDGDYEVKFSDEMLKHIFKHFPGEEIEIESKDFPAEDWRLRIKKTKGNIETVIGGLPEKHIKLFNNRINQYRFHQGCYDQNE